MFDGLIGLQSSFAQCQIGKLAVSEKAARPLRDLSLLRETSDESTGVGSSKAMLGVMVS